MFFDFQVADSAGLASNNSGFTVTLSVVCWSPSAKALMMKKDRKVRVEDEENRSRVTSIMGKSLPSLAFGLQNHLIREGREINTPH
jgi:hypothetical protein